MAAFAGGDVAVRDAKKTDVAMSAIVEPLHQQRDGAFVVIAHRGETGGVAGHQHQRIAPGASIASSMPVNPNSTTPSILRRASMPRCSSTSPGENWLHHNRIVTLFIKGGQHGLYGKVFRQGIQTGDDNRHHFIALRAHGAGGAGGGETVLLHHRFDALAGPVPLTPPRC